MELPRPIREYFEARNTFDASSALAQFADDAVVEDEDLEYRGRDSIGAWIEETQRKYRPTFDVGVVEQARDSVVVTTLVTGAFPGSPLPIDHAFVVLTGKISRLVIG